MVTSLLIKMVNEVVGKLPIKCIPTHMPETNQVQGRRCYKLKMVIFLNPPGKILSHFDVSSDVVTQAIDPIMANDKPKF